MFSGRSTRTSRTTCSGTVCSAGSEYGVFDIHQLHRSLVLDGPENEKEMMIDPDGVHAVEQYVLAKYYLTTNVYRHQGSARDGPDDYPGDCTRY